VNISQQRTAVAPIVEVRDRTDQPVAGAVVSYTIHSGRACSPSRRTPPDGRCPEAAPTRPGPLPIAASAVYQGKTATLTFTQTNLTTAAEATAASGAAGGAATLGALATTAARGASTAAAAAMGGTLPPKLRAR